RHQYERLRYLRDHRARSGPWPSTVQQLLGPQAAWDLPGRRSHFQAASRQSMESAGGRDRHVSGIGGRILVRRAPGGFAPHFGRRDGPVRLSIDITASKPGGNLVESYWQLPEVIALGCFLRYLRGSAGGQRVSVRVPLLLAGVAAGVSTLFAPQALITLVL